MFIDCWFLGHKARTELNKQHTAATKIQARFKGHRARKATKELNKQHAAAKAQREQDADIDGGYLHVRRVDGSDGDDDDDSDDSDNNDADFTSARGRKKKKTPAQSIPPKVVIFPAAQKKRYATNVLRSVPVSNAFLSPFQIVLCAPLLPSPCTLSTWTGLTHVFANTVACAHALRFVSC